MRFLSCAALVCLMVTGFGCLEPKTSDTACTSEMSLAAGQSMYPSVVRLAVKLTCDGEPVPDKTEDDFTILEDGSEVSSYESDLQIVPTVAATRLATALVLDMSGSIIGSGQLGSLQAAAYAFINSLTSDHQLAIYLFDGREDLSPLIAFTNTNTALIDAVNSLSGYEVVDPSTNLNGAVIQGLEVLNADALTHGDDQIYSGSLVIFTDGTDQAGYANNGAALLSVEQTEHAVYTVGLGAEIDASHLDAVGKTGSYRASDIDELESVFDQVAVAISEEANSLYLIAYCSPKRSGTHTLQLTESESGASVSYSFDASGFEAGCDPTDFVPPEFLDLDEDGYRPYDGDCDDTDPNINPEGEEICDGADNDCDGTVDQDAVGAPIWYADYDGDGFGDSNSTLNACHRPSGYVATGTDCDDDNSDVNPNVFSESCLTAYDDDCNGQTNEEDASYCTYFYEDADGDGDGGSTGQCHCEPTAQFSSSTNTDCDDTDATVQSYDWYLDSDGDGYGDASIVAVGCSGPAGYSALDTDCDDTESTTNPGATEYCDGHDDDCDGVTDEDDSADASTWYADNDSDGYGNANSTTTACSQPSGYVASATDCDDTDATVQSYDWYQDADGDGYGDANTTTEACSAPLGFVADNTDCDDTDASLLNSAWFPDADGDGYGDPTQGQCTEPVTSTPHTSSWGTASAFVGANRFRGTVIQADGEYIIDDFGAWLNPSGCSTMDFYVLSSSDSSTWSIEQSTQVSVSSSGLDWYNSGNLGVTTTSGVYYALVYGWGSCSMTYYNDSGGTTGIGSILGSYNGNSYSGSSSVTQSNIFNANSLGYGTTLNYSTLSGGGGGSYVADGTDCDDSDASTNPGATEICGSGVDEDCDGDADCSDSACSSVPPCLTTETICDNGVDEDGDGFVDCSDSDCAADSACSTTETICDNGFDEDGDGFVDCSDSDCAGDSACQASGSDSGTSSPGSPITDYSTITDTIGLSGCGTLLDITVDVDITHSYQGDLLIDVISPASTTVRLWDGTGGSTNDIQGTFTDSGTGLIPAEPLSAFVGESTAGIWTFSVYDQYGGDSGTLNSWGINLVCN